MKKKFIKAAIISSVVVFTACSSRQAIEVGSIPSPEKITTSGNAETRSMINGYVNSNNFKFSKNSKLKNKANRIANKLYLAAGVKYPLYVVNAGDEANAFAFNNNSIVVYEELIRKTKSDDELATVLAHEIGHILGKHCDDDTSSDREDNVSIFSTVLGIATNVASIATGMGYNPALSDLVEDTTEVVATGAYVRSYDRDLEREADHIGLMIMAKAGYDPKAAVSVWERAEEIFGEGSGSGTAFLSTHPSFRDRAKTLEKHLPIALEYLKGTRI